jgi:uncharacterized protein YjbI with pentapeptide repeats
MSAHVTEPLNIDYIMRKIHDAGDLNARNLANLSTPLPPQGTADVLNTIGSWDNILTQFGAWTYAQIQSILTSWAQITNSAALGLIDFTQYVTNRVFSAISGTITWAQNCFSTWATLLSQIGAATVAQITTILTSTTNVVSALGNWTWAQITKSASDVMGTISSWANILTQVGAMTVAQITTLLTSTANVISALGNWTWSQITKSASDVMGTISTWANILTQVGAMTVAQITTHLTSWANVISALGSWTTSQISTMLTSWAQMVTAMGNIAWSQISATAANLMSTISSWANILSQVGSLTVGQILTALTSWTQVTDPNALGTIPGGKIANATITNAQIANATITAANIANATITATQIANATITSAQIASATITAANIANATITAIQIANATITNAQIANATITATQIANATITEAQMSALSIGTPELIANAVTFAKIETAMQETLGQNHWTYFKEAEYLDFIDQYTTVVNDATASNGECIYRSSTAPTNTMWYGPYTTIPGGNYWAIYRLKVDNISSSSTVLTLDVHAARGVLNQRSIAPNQFSAALTWQTFGVLIEIRNNDTNIEIRGMNFQTGICGVYCDYVALLPSVLISGAMIENLSVTAANIANATITAAQIANATITAAQIANATITATQIANATITAAQIANATITAAQIANATITNLQIASGTIQFANVDTNFSTNVILDKSTILVGVDALLPYSTYAYSLITGANITLHKDYIQVSSGTTNTGESYISGWPNVWADNNPKFKVRFLLNSLPTNTDYVLFGFIDNTTNKYGMYFVVQNDSGTYNLYRVTNWSTPGQIKVKLQSISLNTYYILEFRTIDTWIYWYINGTQVDSGQPGWGSSTGLILQDLFIDWDDHATSNNVQATFLKWKAMDDW